MSTSELLNLIVDGVQHLIVLRLIVLTKDLNPATYTDSQGFIRKFDLETWSDKGSVILPTRFRTNEGLFTGWDAISKKLSISAGRSTKRVTVEELHRVCGEAIRTKNFTRHSNGVSEIRLCLSTDLTERIPYSLLDAETRKLAEWTYCGSRPFITLQQFWIKHGKKLSEMPVAPPLAYQGREIQ